MIIFIQDKDRLYDGNYDIVVEDMDSYIKSRILIEKVKSNDISGAVIVITRSSYNAFFDDVYNIDNFSSLKKLSLPDLFNEKGILINNHDLEGLVDYFENINGVKSFVDRYNTSLDLTGNIIAYFLYESDILLKADNLESLFLWINKCINDEKLIWKTKEIRQLIEKVLIKSLDKNYIDLFLSIESKEDFYSISRSILAGYLFSNYPESNKNIIRNKIRFYDFINCSEKLADIIIKSDPNILEHINFIIENMKESLSIFENDQLEQFLRRTKGYLHVEWIWTWECLKTELNSERFLNDLQKIRFWVKESKKELILLENIEKLRQEIEKNYIPSTIDEWFRYYKDFYIKWFSSIERNENIIISLSELSIKNNDFLFDVIKKIRLYKDEIDKKYIEFISHNYPKLLLDDYTIVKAADEIKKYLEKDQVFFFIIDAMNWELWEIVRGLLEENEYFIENDKQTLLSMIPSITSVSRTALICGNTYERLIREKQNLIYTHSVLDEERQFKRSFKEFKAEYCLGGADEIQIFLEKKADIYAFVFSQTDGVLHAAGDSSKKTIESLIAVQINKIVEALKNNEDMVIIVSTDHGSIKVKDMEQKYFDVPDELVVEQHGNSIEISGESFNNDLNNKLINSINLDAWICIYRDDLINYGLPLVNFSGRQVYVWAFPKTGYFAGKKTSGFTHGGLTMQETIIPFGIFRKQPKEYIDIVAEISSSYLFLDELSFIDINIFNPNNFSIKRIEILSKTTGVNMEFTDIEMKGKRKGKIQFVLKNNYCLDDKFKDKLEIKIFYLNDIKIDYLNIDYTYQKKTVSSINSEMAKKRTLDF